MKATSTKLAFSILLLGLVTTAAQADPASSVSSAADQVSRQMAEVFKPLWGTVISALPNDRFVLDVTAENGAYVGMEMEVFREGEPFKHPATGQVLGRMDRQVGVVRVVEVKEQFSLAEEVSLEEGEQIGPGDGVRVTAARILVGLVNVSSSLIGEGQGRVFTREIETALLKTGRFEVMDERLMRTTLGKEGVADAVPLTDPGALSVLRKALRLQAVIYPVVREIDKGIGVELKAVSTISGRSLYLASAEVLSATASAPAGAETQQATASPSAAAAASAAAAPDTPQPAWLGPPGQQRPDTFLAIPYTGIPSARLVLGPEFDGTVRGIAVADMTGDGHKELAVAVRNRINIFAVQGKAFRLLWSSKGTSLEAYSNIMALDAADINRNGVAEIFVTSYYGDAVNSYVLELEKDGWVPIWSNVDLFFRVLPNGNGDPVLYAQRGGQNKPFAGAIKTYVARNGDYEPQVKMKPPGGTYMYNFAIGDVRNDGSNEVVQIDSSRTLRVYKGGKVVSRPPDRFGGTMVSFDFIPSDFAAGSTAVSESDIPMNRIYIHPRLLIKDVDGDGNRELLAVRNSASTTQIFKYAILYEKAKILALHWAATGFQILWETPDLEGYISDIYFGDLGDGGGKVLMFALVKPQALGFSASHSGIFLYRLAPTQIPSRAARRPAGERVLQVK